MSDADRGFDGRLRGLAQEALVAFVADLWEARGRETAVEGSLVRARGDSLPEAEVVLALAAGTDAPATSAVDVVVAAEGRERAEDIADRLDAEAVGPADLRRLVRYGLDRGDADRICEQHLGLRASDLAPPDTGAPRRTDDGGSGTAVPPGGGLVASTGVDGANRGDAAGVDPAADGETDGWARRVVDRRLLGAVLALALITAGVAAGPLSGGPPESAPTADPTTAGPQSPGTDAAGGGAGAGAGTETTDAATPGDDPTPVNRQSATATPDANATDPGRRYVSLRPTCERPPRLVVAVQLGALRNNDAETNDGIRAVRRFASLRNRRLTGTFASFVEIVNSDPYAPILSHEQVGYAPLEVDNGTAQQDVTLTGPEGQTTRYRFRLRLIDRGTYDGCWLTDSVARLDDG